MWNFKSFRFVVASLFIDKDVDFQGESLSGLIVDIAEVDCPLGKRMRD